MSTTNGELEEFLVSRLDAGIKRGGVPFYCKISKMKKTVDEQIKSASALISSLQQLDDTSDDDEGAKFENSEEAMWKRDEIRKNLFLLNNLVIEAQMTPVSYSSSYLFQILGARFVKSPLKQVQLQVYPPKTKSSKSITKQGTTGAIENVTAGSAAEQTPVTDTGDGSTQLQTYPKVDHKKIRREIWWSTPPTPTIIRGFELDILGVQNLLFPQTIDLQYNELEGEVNPVGIVGAEGVGKSTLAKTVLNTLEVKARYVLRIWVPLSEKLHQPIITASDYKDPRGSSFPITVAKRILYALGIRDESIDRIVESAVGTGEVITGSRRMKKKTSTVRNNTKSFLKRAMTLKTKAKAEAKEKAAEEEIEKKKVEEEAKVEKEKRILVALMSAVRLELRGKRYLVVLDGAWSGDEWFIKSPKLVKEEHLLWSGFPKGSGGAVIVTGRCERVVKAMVGGDEARIYRLLPLDDPEICWKIYQDVVGEGVDEEEEEVVDLDNKGEDNVVVTEENGEPTTTDDNDEFAAMKMMDGAVKEESGENEGCSDSSSKKKRMTVKDEVIQRCGGLPLTARLMGEVRKELLKDTKKMEEKKKEEQNERNGEIEED